MNMKLMTQIAAIAVSALPFFLFAEKEYWVAPGEPMDGGSGTELDPFHHPQKAIDTGVAERTDDAELVTVRVKAGTYTFWPAAIPKIWDKTYYWGNEYYALHITNSNVHVIGVDGKALTTVDGGSKSTLPTPGPDVPGKGAPKPTGMRNGHAIEIPAGLENVKVSGFTVTGGYQENCNGTSPTTAVVGSGVIEDCLITVAYRYRCAFIVLSGTAVLRGCEVTQQSGGKATGNVGTQDSDILMSGSSTVEGCYIHDINLPTTSNYGGTSSAYFGIYLLDSGCTVRGCLLDSIVNGHEKISSAYGGGIKANAGTIDNCTVVNCKAMGYGGGIYVNGNDVTVRNCIFWNNLATADAAGNDICVASGKTPTIEYTTYGAGVGVPDTNNQTYDPKFVGGTGAAAYSIPDNSPCAGAGEILGWMTADSKDLAGNARIWTDGTVSMGVYEAQGRSSALSGDFVVVGDAFGRAPFTASFKATPQGAKGTCLYKWDFGDGTPANFTAEAEPTHEYAQVGRYAVTLTIKDDRDVPVSVDRTIYAIAVGKTCYVKENATGQAPFDSWENASSNLQAAVDLKPEVVLVTNGSYAVEYPNGTIDGLRLNYGVEIRSVEGPEKTCLWSGYATAPDVERHIVTISDEQAVLDGFSLEWAYPPALVASAGTVRNCIIRNYYGAGQYNNLINGSAVVSNCVFDGSVGCQLLNANNRGRLLQVEGSAQLVGCEIRNYKLTRGDGCNGAERATLGVAGSAIVRNCYVHDNDLAFRLHPNVTHYTNAAVRVEGGFVDNCTVVSNTCLHDSVGGMVVSGGTVRNCIIAGNSGGSDKTPIDLYAAGSYAGEFSNNLVQVGKLPATAAGCLSGVDPKLEGGSCRLQKDSPCVNAGAKLEWCSKKGMAVDFDGQERRRGGRPDIGCWELQRDLGLVIFVQ